MTLGRCPLSIFCPRGTPPRESITTMQRSVPPECRAGLSASVAAGTGTGLVFKAHRLLYHSTLGLRVIKKKKMDCWELRVPSE